MNMALEEAELKDEVEMENILKNDPDQIEKGLKIIANQVKTPNGRIDLLAVDTEGVLTIIELKISSDEGQLIQTIRYCDWALENIDWIQDAYKIEISDQKPRMILIASEFSEDITVLAKYWNEYISSVALYTYRCLKVYDKKNIICTEYILQAPTEIQEKPKNIQDHLSYFRDDVAKENCIKTIDIVKKFADRDIEVFPKKWGIVIKYKGRNFMAIYPKRENFVIEWKSDDEEKKWKYKTGLKRMEQINEVLENNIKKAFELVGGKLK